MHIDDNIVQMGHLHQGLLWLAIYKIFDYIGLFHCHALYRNFSSQRRWSKRCCVWCHLVHLTYYACSDSYFFTMDLSLEMDSNEKIGIQYNYQAFHRVYKRDSIFLGIYPSHHLRPLSLHTPGCRLNDFACSI